MSQIDTEYIRRQTAPEMTDAINASFLPLAILGRGGLREVYRTLAPELPLNLKWIDEYDPPIDRPTAIAVNALYALVEARRNLAVPRSVDTAEPSQELPIVTFAVDEALLQVEDAQKWLERRRYSVYQASPTTDET